MVQHIWVMAFMMALVLWCLISGVGVLREAQATQKWMRCLRVYEKEPATHALEPHSNMVQGDDSEEGALQEGAIDADEDAHVREREEATSYEERLLLCGRFMDFSW